MSTNAPDLTLIDIGEVCRMTALGRSTIYDWVKAGSFPKGHSFGTRTVRWLKSDVQRWIAEKVGMPSAA